MSWITELHKEEARSDTVPSMYTEDNPTEELTGEAPPCKSCDKRERSHNSKLCEKCLNEGHTKENSQAEE